MCRFTHSRYVMWGKRSDFAPWLGDHGRLHDANPGAQDAASTTGNIPVDQDDSDSFYRFWVLRNHAATSQKAVRESYCTRDVAHESGVSSESQSSSARYKEPSLL